ncbi:hypothetical protein [Methylocaldum sp.]|uniref:hypothetical protein n=1 Tax=Methylocaldum sp. TaxID=1969727 RepID=UPI002D3569AF|nr:hypothetical protein [Methylocaldum sp.]HYE35777.1 hypothetical protein [Methylocaldum sp.]
MKTNSHQNESDLEIHTFRLRFEGAANIALDTSGYWCGADGRLIEGGDTLNGKLLLALTASELERGRLLIVPVPTDAFHARQVTAEDLLSYNAFEPQTTLNPEVRHHILPEIPESLWRFWSVYRGLVVSRPKPAWVAMRSW